MFAVCKTLSFDFESTKYFSNFVPKTEKHFHKNLIVVYSLYCKALGKICILLNHFPMYFHIVIIQSTLSRHQPYFYFQTQAKHSILNNSVLL